jgi:queuine tRNA-ribosyltransferase
MFKLVESCGKARIGKLKTLHGFLETPCFLPVATKAAAKHLSPRELKDAGFNALIANSFLLSLSPGVAAIARLGGLHSFMGWDKVIFTDSGGFQMLNQPFFHKTTEEAGFFRSPFNGKTYAISPEKAIEIQQGLGSDVMMCLDEMPLYTQTKLQVASATRRTHTWARRCLAARRNCRQLLFGIVQGGTFKDLRQKSARFMSELDFDGMSIGGLAVGEPRQKMHGMLRVSLPFLPEAKPRYLMGLGSPEDLLDSIGMGIDIFDSAFPTQNARHGTLFTLGGKLKITNAKHRESKKAVEQDCGCYLCTNFSRSYLHHLFRMGEPLGLRLASLHNLHFMSSLLNEVRTAIREQRLMAHKKEFLKSYLS